MASDDLETMLARLRHAVSRQIVPLEGPGPAFVLFVSFSDTLSRARTLTVSAAGFRDAWNAAVETLRQRLAADKTAVRWLRIDWVEAVEEIDWKTLKERLQATKRNYFRHGLALDRRFKTAFLETELNANAMLYGGPSVPHAVVNEANFSRYAKLRHGIDMLIMPDDAPVFQFSARAAFTALGDAAVHLIGGAGPDAGRRAVGRLEPRDVQALIERGSRYLATQMGEDGRFIYGWHPCFDRPIKAYNSLRHASTLYAMIEAWEVTRDAELGAAIEHGLHYLTETLIQTVPRDDGDLAVLVDANAEVKLGGNAVCLLALVKYSEVTGTDRYLPLLEKLALAMLRMQDPATGKFVHVLNYPSLTVKEPFRIVYYDGEAAFGLMRLYALTKDSRWLAAVERGFAWFIAARHWQAHDHWLAYAANELTRYRPRREYFEFGLKNFAGYLDFVANRITTFPTLLELMMAARQMVRRLEGDAEFSPLLETVDLDAFHAALEKRAHYLLNGHFWPELAMFYANPQRIAGSFFIRHHAFRVRIDDVEHYLSGLIAYGKDLRDQDAGSVRPRKPAAAASGWSVEHVVAATGGTWVVPPPENWRATGLSTFAPAMQPGNLAVVRTGDETVGMLQRVVGRMRPLPAAIIASHPSEIDLPGCPVLGVTNAGEAVLSMGRYSRDRMKGKIVGVTGSAGKTTTVAMMAHALSPWGSVCKSAHNANLPHGVAWNLASIPWNTPYSVLELAVGRMAVSARMARPDIAIFTNVMPAHLGAVSTLRDIARTKSAIFLGMAEGAHAVINRDMSEWETVLAAAKDRKLGIVSFGTDSASDFRLLDFDPLEREVHALLSGKEVRYRIGASGRHMATNSLAVLAAVSSLGLELEPALEKLAGFAALPGRGEEFLLALGDRTVKVIDDAYNANPGSMAAALNRLDKEIGTRRIAVLGEMAELGPQAETYHTQLAQMIEGSSIDRVYVTGTLYADFWQELPGARRGAYADSLETLKGVLSDELAEGDVVLFKGSHSTRVHELVSWFKDRASAG